MSRSRTICTLALAVGFLAFATSAKAATPNQILSNLASQQTHSWIDNSLDFDGQYARYKAGHRLNIACGYVSELGRRLLAEQGYVSRVVQVITKEPWNYLSDGHAMLEVWHEGQWTLYDVDANVEAVDASGRGVSLETQMVAVREGRAYWREIANDPLYREDEPNLQFRELAAQIFGDPEAFYRRMMGISFYPTDAAGTGWYGVYYIDSSQTERLRTAGLLVGRSLADPKTWYNLTGVNVTAAAPVVAAPTRQVQTAPAAPVVTPTTPTIQRRSCTKLKRQYRRTHTKRALRKYRRCVRTSRFA
jgi:hypothetical protein